MYADLIDNEGIRAEFLVVMKPARKVSGFTVDAGSVYKLDFDYGEVIEVTQNGVALAQGSSATLSAGQFYYDVDLARLYVRMTDSSNPSTKFVVATYEIYAGTSAEHFYRVPDDNSTRQVFFDSLVSKAPELKQTQSDGLSGYVPVQSSQITLINAEHWAEKHIYDSSFNQRSIQVYHWLDTLEVDNVKLVMDGVMADISYDSTSVQIAIKDSVDRLDQEFRNPGTSFWATSDFANLDRNYLGRPIRYVYGRVDGLIPVNLDYVNNAPTTSDNRIWGVRSDKTKLNDITHTVIASPASTTTRIYLNSVSGFMVDDCVRVTKTTPESVFITAVGANYIDITPALVSGVPVASDTVTRPTISRVSIIQNNVRYDALYIRDYTQNTSLAADVLGFTFDTSLEANLGLPSTLSPNDKVFVRVYGKQNDVTLGGPSLGGNDTDTGNLTAPAPILIDLLKTRLGLAESSFNAASFTALNTYTTEALSMAIPSNANSDFPTYKTILINIIETILLRFIIDKDTKFKVDIVKPLTTATKTIDELGILEDSFRYNFDYSDLISFVRVEYAMREVSDDAAISGSTSQVVTSTSDTARYLHLTSQQKTIKSLHLKEADAQALADHMAFIFGDRSGKLSFDTKNAFFDSELADTIEVNRIKLPGFDYDGSTVRTRNLSLISATKGLRRVSLEMLDQKGIEDADDASLW